MNKEQLFELYSKLYFHEMDVKEKLVNRMQLLFVLIISLLTTIVYMLRVVDYTSSLPALILFYATSIISFLLLTISTVFGIKAFWGNEYKGLPTSDITEQYVKNAIEHQAQLEQYQDTYPDQKNKIDPYNHEVATKEYLYNKFLECSSHNTKINDKRSENIHNSVKWLLSSGGVLLVSGIFFIAFDLDTSSPRKKNLIKNENQIKIIHIIDGDIKNCQ